jgi:hypothetical protein
LQGEHAVLVAVPAGAAAAAPVLDEVEAEVDAGDGVEGLLEVVGEVEADLLVAGGGEDELGAELLEEGCDEVGAGGVTEAPGEGVGLEGGVEAGGADEVAEGEEDGAGLAVDDVAVVADDGAVGVGGGVDGVEVDLAVDGAADEVVDGDALVADAGEPWGSRRASRRG